MSGFLIRRAIFSVIILSQYKVSLTTKEIHKNVLSQFVSRLMQPASIELWRGKSCGIHLDARVITSVLKEQNTTFIYQREMTTSRIIWYATKVSMRNLPSYSHLYILIDISLFEKMTVALEALERVFRSVNFVVCSGSVLQVTSAHEVLCSTIQLILAPEKNVALIGLPVKNASNNGCSHWKFHDYQSLTTHFPFHIPWLHNVGTPIPTLRNAVIRGTCHKKCNISRSITLLSQMYNFTIADCSDRHVACDFIEHEDRRSVRGVITSGYFQPLIIFSSQSSAFLAPRGALLAQWKYLSRPFEVSAWIGFLFCFAALLCFLLLSFIRLNSTFSEALNHLWLLSEFLLWSLFTPIRIPRRTRPNSQAAPQIVNAPR